MTDQVENTQASEPTGNEVEARSGGWVPKEEYHGDENKWVDADEFVRRGPLFKKIDTQTRELKEVKKALDQLKAHHANVKETAFKEALDTLKAQKREAFVDGDPDKIIEIDEKIADTKEEQRRYAASRVEEVRQNVQTDAVHPEFAAWTNRNTWYESSKPMRAFADALGVELGGKGLSPSEVLKEVEKQVKEEFPNKFRNPNRDKAGSVEGTGKGGGKSGGEYQLTAMERQIMDRFVRQGVMTKEAYIAELKQSKD